MSYYSNVGNEFFLCDAGKAGADGTTYTKLEGVTDATPFTFITNVEKSNPMDNGGWAETAPTTKEMSPLTVNLLRRIKASTYDYLKNWHKQAIAGEPEKKDIVYMINNGDEDFVANVATVNIKSFVDVKPNAKEGQKYSVTLEVTGPPTYGTGTISNGVPTLNLENDSTTTNT